MEGNYSMGRVVDLTAYKIEQMVEANAHDGWVQQALLDILADYYLGLIAIGWEDGSPVVMQLKDNDKYGQWLGGIPPGFAVVSLDASRVTDRRDGYDNMLPYDPEEDPEDPNDV